MILDKDPNMYHTEYDTLTEIQNLGDLNNRLLATFVNKESIEDTLQDIQNKYTILYNKIFILEVIGKDELVITYNVDQGNISIIPENTILVHRKKESNTLYTINALNQLIKSLNGGVVDTSFKIDWKHYRNCVLLTQHNELNQLNTKIHRIIDL